MYTINFNFKWSASVIAGSFNSAKNQDKFVKNLVDTIGKLKTEITESAEFGLS